MKRLFKFSKPKGPGFGISAAYYLSVLSTRPTLPSILHVINPAGEGGAVEGFGAPLSQSAPKDALGLPLTRGAYALATKDRKSVVKMLVLSKEEAGFDPEIVARHSQLLGVEGELLNRIRAAWTIVQLRFEAHDPDVYPALDFVLGFCTRLGLLTEAAIADPLAERYILPEQLFVTPRSNPLVDAREHVAVHVRPSEAGLHMYTRGLVKFVQPEFELLGVPVEDQQAAASTVMTFAQQVLMGNLVRPGMSLGRFNVTTGGADPRLWEGIPCLELQPKGSMKDALAQPRL